MDYRLHIPEPSWMARNRRLLILTAALLFVVALAGGYWFFNKDKMSEVREPEASQVTEPPQEQEAEEPAYVPVDLQPVIDEWVSEQAATYSIVVYDVQAEENIGVNLPDEEYFAASLYKLFVAYLALQDFQSGEQDPDEILTQGFTRKQCVDKMIRESHSPCGEAMMADMGPADLEARLKAMGVNHTSFAGIQTTAQDTALILRYVLERRHLNETNTAFLLDAMHDQPDTYERGLKRGASDATWYTKVGWNEQENYHDVGIMTTQDGRQFVIAILSQDQGSSAPIADFASTVYTALTQ